MLNNHRFQIRKEVLDAFNHAEMTRKPNPMKLFQDVYKVNSNKVFNVSKYKKKKNIKKTAFFQI